MHPHITNEDTVCSKCHLMIKETHETVKHTIHSAVLIVKHLSVTVNHFHELHRNNELSTARNGKAQISDFMHQS